MAEQSTSQGRQAVREYRAKMHQESRTPLESSKEKPQGTAPSPKKFNEGAVPSIKLFREGTENKATADQLNKNSSEHKKYIN